MSERSTSNTHTLLKKFQLQIWTFLSFCQFVFFFFPSLPPSLPPPPPLLYPVIYKYSRCALWSGLQFVTSAAVVSAWRLSPHPFLALPSIGYKLYSGDLVFTSVSAHVCMHVCVCVYRRVCLCVCVWIMHVTVLMSPPATAPPGPPSP